MDRIAWLATWTAAVLWPLLTILTILTQARECKREGR